MEAIPHTEVPPDEASIHVEIAALRAKVDVLMHDCVTPAVMAVADRAETAAHRATDQLERLTTIIREKPLACVILAAACGYILATLRRR